MCRAKEGKGFIRKKDLWKGFFEAKKQTSKQRQRIAFEGVWRRIPEKFATASNPILLPQIRYFAQGLQTLGRIL